MRTARVGRKSAVCVLFGILLAPVVSGEATIVPADVFDPVLLLPLLIAVVSALALWRLLLPLSLSNLQVAFEVDDDLYEVHRLTKSREDVFDLLRAPGVSVGTIAYLLSMAGIMLIVAELLLRPETFYEPVIYMMALLVGFPILISPFVTLYAQLGRGKSERVRERFAVRMYGGITTFVVLVLLTATVLFIGLKQSGGDLARDGTIIFGEEETFVRWSGYALLTFMAPTILAYGRIMGASWNTLLLNKWRTVRGQLTPMDPDPPGLIKRLVSMIIVIFLATMPFVAINGIMTLAYVEIEQPAHTNELLDLGGIVGWEIYQIVEDNSILQKLISLKMLRITLASYLMLNVAIVGLAFIFELTRNLFLGGQVFGGIGGVTIAQPREIRSERSVQGRVLYFGLAGFSGYTVLLLIMQAYKEFNHLMPYSDNPYLAEELLLAETWQFIAAGQAVFMLTWLMSLSRFGKLRQLRFDLSPDERREGEIMSGGGDWMRQHISRAAYNDNIGALRQFREEKIEGDQSMVRLEKSRARMLECGLRGLWPEAIDTARKVLAQQGGDDDEARMMIAAGQIACRRLDAAREAIRGMEQPDGYDEPELLSFIAEWFDPWNGAVDVDDLYDWENVSCLDLLSDLQRRLRSWDPVTRIDASHSDNIALHGMLSSVAQLRSQRRGEEALALALDCVRLDPSGAKTRIAVALCLIDSGDWFEAMDVFEELQAAHSDDPRVRALGGILAFDCPTEEMESALAVGSDIERKRWINDAPVNPVAALNTKRGADEALNANVFIAGHEAIERNVSPRYRQPIIHLVLNYGVFMPIWLIIGLLAHARTDDTVVSAVLAASLITLHLFYRRFRRQQRRIIRHRDQKAMITYAKRLRRHKVNLDLSRIPVGTHLLLSGLLVTINGVVYDLGMPAWLVVRLPKERDRTFRERVRKRVSDLRSRQLARTEPLPNEWWDKRPKPMKQDMRVLEKLIGPAAYRGRQLRGGLASGSAGGGSVDARVPVMQTDPGARNIPTHSIKEEHDGPRRPSSRPGHHFKGGGVTKTEEKD